MNLESTAQPMADLIALLKEDIAKEWAHMHFYLACSIQIQGPERAEYKEFLEEKANEEMSHVKEWGKMLMGLGEQVVPSCPDDYPHDLCRLDQILDAAIELEKEVVFRFCQRKLYAEAIAESSCDPQVISDATYVALFLEDQILDSKGDVDELTMMRR